MVVMIIMIGLLGSVAVFFIIRMDKKSRKQNKRQKFKNYNKLFTNYHQFFLTRKGIETLYYRLSELSVYSYQELRAIAVKFYTTAIGTFLIINITGLILFRDVFTSLLFFLFAFMVKTVLVEKQIDHIHFKLLGQLLKALSNIRQAYLRLGVIPDAISEAEVGSLLKHAFEDIYLILTAVDGEKRLEEFYAATPFKLLQTFAGVCYILNNKGDSKLSNGASNFIQAMGMMHSEVQMEVQKLVLQKSKFGVLEYLPVVPLIAIKIVESFFADVIPGTTIIYNGPIGYISRVVIVLASIIGYTTISKINSTMVVKKDDRNSIVKKILSINSLSNFINTILPKKTRKVNKKLRLLKRSMSMKDMIHHYATKILFAFTAFIFSLFFVFFSVELGKDFIHNNVREVSLVGGESLSKEDIEIRKKIDEIYLNTYPMMSQNETKTFVENHLPKLQEFDKQAQIQRLQTKYSSYYSTYFKWWMILICYGIALAAWKVPELMLRARIWLLKTEAEEDILQLQTIITILMNTSMDTMDTLYWLQLQSRVFKNVLIDAYHEYASDPELALHKLKNKVDLPEFKRIIDKLILTIHRIPLADAFSDLITEREHVLRIREISQQTTLKKKRAFVSPLAMAPLALTVFCYILLPLGILGIKEFTNALQNLGI